MMFAKSYQKLDDNSSHHGVGELDHYRQEEDQKNIIRSNRSKFKDEASKPLLLDGRYEEDEEEEVIKDKKEEKPKTDVRPVKMVTEDQKSQSGPAIEPEPVLSDLNDSMSPMSTSSSLLLDLDPNEAESKSGSHPLVLLYQSASTEATESPADTKLEEEKKLAEDMMPTTPSLEPLSDIDESLGPERMIATSPPPKPPKPIQKSTNPFDEAPSSSHPAPPNHLQKSKSTNPFDSDYHAPQSTSQPSKPMKKSQSVGVVSTNPFDSDVISSPTVVNSSQRSNPLKIPSSPSSGGSSLPRSPSSPQPALAPFSENSPEYSNLILLLQLGFQPSQAYQSLVIHHELPLALSSLRHDLINSLILKTAPNWYPPFLTRIGSWMPSQANNSSRVLYYIKVQVNHTDLAYVITKRFSEFVSLYHQVAPYFHRNCQNLPSTTSPGGVSGTNSLNPNNVLIPFVDDRISGYLWGTSEELCNRRQDMLHKWLSFLCLSERMMTDLTIAHTVMEFLQVESFIKRVPVVTGNPERPLIIQ
jgi:hypothetical protein